MRLFLDANVFFAGCLSKDGASAFVLQLARRERFELVASRLVLLETERNLRQKTSAAALKSFHGFLRQVRVRVVPQPNEEAMKPYEGMIALKDLPVFVSAVVAKADSFLTLDRKHFLSTGVAAKIKKPGILSPADFLRNVYLKGKI